jgi:5'-nucleotidase
MVGKIGSTLRRPDWVVGYSLEKIDRRGASCQIDAMRILLSNDDGIYAPGIAALYEAVRDLADVDLVAPSSERSAVGHAITLSDPLKVREVRRNGQLFGYAVSGTPADCVKLAVEGSLLGHKPDLVVSGINLGPNAGISVIYSGTVSAATEGTILGIPSLAISLNTFTDPLWDTAKRIARHIVSVVMERGLPPQTLLNVNIPNKPFDQLKGYRVTRMGQSRFVEIFHRRTDPRGNLYFWMDGDLEQLGDTRGTDVEALKEDSVSLTPIWFDLTHHAVLDTLRGWKIELPR